MNISNWLRKTPRPVAVLADEQRIEVGKNVRAIRDLVQTVKAMSPSKLTCLDVEGNVLRSIVLDADSEDSDESSVSASTPEQSDLQLFAKLLAEGYEHGRKANQPIIDSAMQFVERQGQRLLQAEREIDRLRQVIHKQHLQIAEMNAAPIAEGPSGDDSIMGALVAGIAQGAAKGAVQSVTPISSKGGQK